MYIFNLFMFSSKYSILVMILVDLHSFHTTIDINVLCLVIFKFEDKIYFMNYVHIHKKTYKFTDWRVSSMFNINLSNLGRTVKVTFFRVRLLNFIVTHISI